MSASVRGRLARLEGARPSAELSTARAALRDLGRGLAAVVELLDEHAMTVTTPAARHAGESSCRGDAYVPGAALRRVAEADRGSLLGGLARALTGMAS